MGNNRREIRLDIRCKVRSRSGKRKAAGKIAPLGFKFRPPDRAAEPFDRAAEPFDRAVEPFDHAAEPFGRAVESFDRAAK
jgi:hypothetical protein